MVGTFVNVTIVLFLCGYSRIFKFSVTLTDINCSDVTMFGCIIIS